MISSIPTFQKFSPIGWQWNVIRDVRSVFDYSKGVHEVMLSGSVGSAKTLLLAHIVISHCTMFPGAVAGIGRLTMPSLKETLFDTIMKHIGDDIEVDHNQVRSVLTFPNGSKIISFSWADGHYTKFRSYEFSLFAVEELTENDKEDFYREMSMRVGRLSHVPEKLIISATNPDDPTHWAYKHFVLSKSKMRHVYYSITADNPFLPTSYIDSLKENLSERMARRMLYGEWLEIHQDVIYYAYRRDQNFKDVKYVPSPSHPIRWCWDFNIGEGKPFSTCFFQHIDGVFHFFNEIIVQGFRTEDILEEASDRGILDLPNKFIIYGDATGRRSDTRSKKHDYDIIKTFLANYKTKSGSPLVFEVDVPLSNPRVRDRHNTVNAQICNAKDKRSVFVYQDAPTVDEGFRLTKLKKGSQYIEDDGPNCPWQHVSTAAGYGMMRVVAKPSENRMKLISR